MPTIKAAPLIPIGTEVGAYPVTRRVGSQTVATAIEMERQNGIRPSETPSDTATINVAGEAVMDGLIPGAYVLHATVPGDRLETVAGQPRDKERYISFRVYGNARSLGPKAEAPA